ncbi:hypothetical protein [Acuticoccus kandeliae]|uniref:hypothetical protein n=1 Tax=Acuticoccus kandeliae TaxID=2073160 RepID=UPI000D3EA651|nr:hypothetical protein [Acuticoccus kandeliae]
MARVKGTFDAPLFFNEDVIVPKDQILSIESDRFAELYSLVVGEEETSERHKFIVGGTVDLNDSYYGISVFGDVFIKVTKFGRIDMNNDFIGMSVSSIEGATLRNDGYVTGSIELGDGKYVGSGHIEGDLYMGRGDDLTVLMVNDKSLARDPEDVFMDYSVATGDEDWVTVATRLAAPLGRSEP